MSATSSTSNNQLQDSLELKEKKPVPSEFTRALSPGRTGRNPNVQENNGRSNAFSPPRTMPPPPREPSRNRANHSDKNNPSGKSFIGKMELIDTLLLEIDESDSRKCFTPSQIKKMAAKNQPLPIQLPGSILKKSPSSPMPSKASSPSPAITSLSLESPPTLSPSQDRKPPPPARPARYPEQDKSPDQVVSAHDQLVRDQPILELPPPDKSIPTPARDQPARVQPSRDQPTRPSFGGKDSPDQVRPSSRQNALAGGSRAMLAQSRIPQSLPPPPPPLPLLDPSESTEALSPLEEAMSPRSRGARTGLVPVLPIFSTLNSTAELPPKIQTLSPPDFDSSASPDKKLVRKSPRLATSQDEAALSTDATVDHAAYFPRYLPPPPPPSTATPSPSNLSNVYSVLPPPPPLPPAGDSETPQREGLGESVRRSREVDDTTPDDVFKFTKGGRSSLGKGSKIQISTTRSNASQLSTSAELSHSHSAPNLLLHDSVSSSPLSTPSVLSPLSSSGSISAPSSPSTTAPTPTSSSDPSDLTYEQRMRKKLITEIVTTEIDYVKDLELIIEVYLHPLRASKMLNEDQIHTIFSDLEILLNFNKILKAELEKQHGLADSSATKIGSAFLTMSPFLKLYSAYCSNQPIAFKALEDYKKANPNFAKFLSDTAYDARCKGLFLSSYLIKPVQRVCKYPLFLRDLLKYTPRDHVDYAGLVEAETMINSVVQAINEYKRALEAYHSVVELANIMDGIDDLVQPTRKFVAEGDVMCCFDLQGIQKPRRLHLFNDVLLICKKRETRQILQHSKRIGWRVKDRVDLSTARLISLAVDCLDFALEISCEKEKFILVFPNDVQWNKWSKLLKDQIIQNRVASHTRRGLLLISEQNSVHSPKTPTTKSP